VRLAISHEGKEEEIKDSSTKGTIWSHRLSEAKTCQRPALLSSEDDLGIVSRQKIQSIIGCTLNYGLT
jgi:hypothetical protein